MRADVSNDDDDDGVGGGARRGELGRTRHEASARPSFLAPLKMGGRPADLGALNAPDRFGRPAGRSSGATGGPVSNGELRARRRPVVSLI
jgi:hypothetical protein